MTARGRFSTQDLVENPKKRVTTPFLGSSKDGSYDDVHHGRNILTGPHGSAFSNNKRSTMNKDSDIST